MSVPGMNGVDAYLKPNSLTTSTPIMGKGAHEMDMNDFLKLLVAQMTHQDMMNPTSDTEFIAQMAQFTALQGIQTIQEYQLSAYAASYAGKYVAIAHVNDAGIMTKVEGFVEAVTFYDGEPKVVVKGIKGALANPPRDVLVLHPALLAVKAVDEGLPQQRAFIDRQEQMGHVVLKHGACPTDGAGVGPAAGHGADEGPPMFFAHQLPGHRVVAGQPGLAEQKVVVGLAQRVCLDIVADRKQILLFVVEDGQVALVDDFTEAGNKSGHFRFFAHMFPKPLHQSHQRADKVAAVHAGDKFRLEGIQRDGVVPVVEVALPGFQLLDAGNRALNAQV